MSTLENGFVGLQNSADPFWHRGKNSFVNFERYDLAIGEE